MNEILANLFGDNQCSFEQAMVEWLLIGLGFFLIGWLLRRLFRKHNYKKSYIELEREYRALSLDKNSLLSERNSLKDKVNYLERQLKKHKS